MSKDIKKTPSVSLHKGNINSLRSPLCIHFPLGLRQICRRRRAPTKPIIDTKMKGGEYMELLPQDLKKQIPALYSQENTKDPIIYCKFFDPTGSWTWYVTEGEEQENGDFLFFGLVVGFESELGYFSLQELKDAKRGMTGIQVSPIERDLQFVSCKLSEVKEQG